MRAECLALHLKQSLVDMVVMMDTGLGSIVSPSSWAAAKELELSY